MGYFITPMISIILGYFFLNEKITKPKFASVCLMFLGILFLFINLNQFPFLIIWIGTSWAIYGLLRKQVNVNPSIGLLYETFIISLISIYWFESLMLGFIIGLAMILNLLIAGFSGIAIPLVLDKLKIDPALASAVILTTITDVFGFLSFLGLATLFLI